ncbi:di-/tripeptide transporter [Psychromonas sp. CNPT3]|uniref:peptide MFS transporter n=1 Tax=Psychromonas sp. CNPT3 TaxID=314282 RepID=UPI00006E5693|nr:peptide MFS transporter [Psychromonas sp. CNPT3]AGH81511.1 di-/tripeptide transporter [Psychromonas sp. CNPT3]
MLSKEDTMLGHPKGLFLLFGTELWERFSYYSMRAILVIYLTDKTINGGMGWTTAEALNLYGIYTGLVYFTPLIGGWLSDNYVSKRLSLLIGGALMAVGQFILALPDGFLPMLPLYSFYLGLAFIVVGNGMFKPNVSSMLGDLYPAGDNRRDSAFTIFYMGINVGSLLAGIVVGIVTGLMGWKSGFVAAGIGMLISLVIQMVFAQRYLGEIGKIPSAKMALKNNKSKVQEPLTKIEIDRLKVIMVLGLFVVVFWAGFEQAGGLMNLYSHEYTDRIIAGFEIPASWFQSLNPFFIIILAPIMAIMWGKMGPKEPHAPVKFAMALFFLALGFLCMIGAALEQGADLTAKTSMLWLVGAYFFHTLGELCLSPIGLSMITKLAPLRLASVMMGTWFAFNALSNYIAGLIGSRVGSLGALDIFAGIAVASVIAGVLLLILSDTLIRWMHQSSDGSFSHIHPEELEDKNDTDNDSDLDSKGPQIA